MNQHQGGYLDTQQPMSGGQQYAPHHTAGGNMSQYGAYPSQSSPSVMSSGHQYAPSPSAYNSHYGYGAGMGSPHGSAPSVPPPIGQVTSGHPPLPTMSATPPSQYMSATSGSAPSAYSHQPDLTGQIGPSNVKPRVTATLWEDEGCMCFQVESKGVCVARRDDNHMVNGTKLLNVAGMTRGRRDGILKTEKVRHVVKIGPMHLKGVWIPFERALEFANREKITESLYPIFVHNVGALLYSPANNRSQITPVHQNDRRRPEKLQGSGMSNTQSTLTHHSSVGSAPDLQQPATVASNSSAARPSIDRAHTFPTPPTSASGTATSMGSHQGSYDWGNNPNLAQVQNLEGHQSTPATPATTPPHTALPSLQAGQGQHSIYGNQSSRSAQYGNPHGLPRASSMSSSTYPKHDMGPPSRTATGRVESEHEDVKVDPYGQHQTGDDSHVAVDPEGEAEQDSEYASGNAQAYGSHRGSFDAYSSNYGNDNTHMGQDAIVNGGSGRATPRTSQTWSSGFQNSPRGAPSSNLYNPTSDARGTLANNSSGAETYVSGPYAPTQQINGMKRQREDDDADAMKRQKLATSGSNGLVNGTYEGDRPMNRPRMPAAKPARVR